MRTQIPKKFGAEKRDLEFYHRRQFHDALTHHIIYFDGRIDYNRLVRAIRLSLDAEPYLGCRFVDKFPYPYWERRDDLDQVELCKLVSSRNVDQMVEAFVIQPISDVYRDLQYQYRVIRSEIDVLCIKTNHMLSDGHGSLEYIEILSHIYRQLKDNPDYEPPINTQGSRSLRQITRHFSLKERVNILRCGFKNWRQNLFPRSNWAFPLKRGDDNDRGFVIRKIDPVRLKALKSYSKERGASINDVLLAAYCHAMRKMSPSPADAPCRIIIPVSFRKYIPSGKGEAICNLTGVFQFNLGERIGEHFEETLAIIRNRMNEYKNGYLGWGDYSYMFYGFRCLPFAWARMANDLFSRFNRILGPKQIPPGFSNVGIIPSRYYNFGDVNVKNAILPGPVIHFPLFLFGGSTFKENMALYGSYSNVRVNRPIIENFIDMLLEILPS